MWPVNLVLGVMHFDVFMGILLVWSQTSNFGTLLKRSFRVQQILTLTQNSNLLSAATFWVLGQRKLIIPQWMSHINLRPPLCHQDMKYVGHSSFLNIIYSKPEGEKTREKLELSVLWYYGDQRWTVQRQKVCEDAVSCAVQLCDKIPLIYRLIFPVTRSEPSEADRRGNIRSD